MTARKVSSRLWCSRMSKSFSWICGPMPASAHSRERYQQLTPLPQSHSAGGMPVCNTYTMPLRQARSETGCRPSLR